MIAQASPEIGKSLIDRLPDILKSVAGNPLGFAALITITLSVLALFLFRSSKSKDKIKLIVFCVVAVCGLVLAAMVIYTANNGQSGGGNPVSVTDCKVAGHVYDDDAKPAVGIQNVKLAYLAFGTTNEQPMQVATTGPDGSFLFICSQIKPEAFPIRLRATYKNQAIESEDALFFGENPSVNLYLSPVAIANHYRISKEIMRVSSANLLQQNYSVLTNTSNATPVPVNHILAVPKNVKLQKDEIRVLRTKLQ